MQKVKPAARKAREGDRSGPRDVDARIAAVEGWRGETLAKLRTLIKKADPAVTESVKWKKASSPLGVPVWEHHGVLCTGEVYKDYVKATFAFGASLPDPAKLFNAADTGATRRAIDFREGVRVDEKAFIALVRAAAAFNAAKTAAKKPVRPRRKVKTRRTS